jgi:hypothetical protein
MATAVIAAASVRPTWAISGSVKVTQGSAR